MNLAKKYKQLFEGKVRSNDSTLLKEVLISRDDTYADLIDSPFLVYSFVFPTPDHPLLSKDTRSYGDTYNDPRWIKIEKEFAKKAKPSYEYFKSKFEKLDPALWWNIDKVASDDDSMFGNLELSIESLPPIWDKQLAVVDDVFIFPTAGATEDLELDNPVSVTFDSDARLRRATISGMLVESITLHYWGYGVNLNAEVPGLDDYYPDDAQVIEDLYTIVEDDLMRTSEYKGWIKDIEKLGAHKQADIEKMLSEVQYTEHGMNQDGAVSTESQ